MMNNKILGIAIVSVLVFIMIGGAVWWFVQKNNASVPSVSYEVPTTTTTPQDSSVPTNSNAPVNPIAKNNTQPIAPSDCGISTSFKSVTDSNLATFNFEGDTALVCMGKSVINECVNSQATITDDTGAKNIMQVRGAATNCQINLIFDKGHGQTNLQCPVNKLMPFDAQGKTSDGTTMTQIKSTPGKYSAALYQMSNIALFTDIAESCSGTALTEGIKQ